MLTRRRSKEQTSIENGRAFVLRKAYHQPFTIAVKRTALVSREMNTLATIIIVHLRLRWTHRSAHYRPSLSTISFSQRVAFRPSADCPCPVSQASPENLSTTGRVIFWCL